MNLLRGAFCAQSSGESMSSSSGVRGALLLLPLLLVVLRGVAHGRVCPEPLMNALRAGKGWTYGWGAGVDAHELRVRLQVALERWRDTGEGGVRELQRGGGLRASEEKERREGRQHMQLI